MKNFINQRSDLVSQAIDGLLAVSDGRLQRFDDDAHARVVLRTDWDRNKVALISGGGSGHEPAHAGFVGKGMLTAAVCGDVFASPSVDAVLAAILAVTGEAGCLLIVKNYTGDRLNFGLAAEKAKARGVDVDVVIVGDDVAIPGIPQPRGVAGTLFVHKIAGHLAEQGKSLEEIAAAARDVIDRMATLGVSRDTCTVPGNVKVSRVPDGEVEIGLGIHGEPGIETRAFTGSGPLIEEICRRLTPALGESDERLAAMVNNLGGLSGLEMSVLMRDLAATPLAERIDWVVGPASLMTALDMPGFSISCLRMRDGDAVALTAPTEASAWPALQPLSNPTQVTAPIIETVAYQPSDGPQAKRIIETVAETCVVMEAEINALDTKVGDGDTGSTFAAAARAVQAISDDLPYSDGATLLRVLSDLKTRSMGGSSGVLLAIFLAAAADAFEHNPDWPSALAHGLEAMQQYGGASSGDRTMIDALEPAIEALRTGAPLKDVARAANDGAARTALMTQARAGRSAHVTEAALRGVMDPGAAAIGRMFSAIADQPAVSAAG